MRHANELDLQERIEAPLYVRDDTGTLGKVMSEGGPLIPPGKTEGTKDKISADIARSPEPENGKLKKEEIESLVQDLGDNSIKLVGVDLENLKFEEEPESEDGIKTDGDGTLSQETRSPVRDESIMLGKEGGDRPMGNRPTRKSREKKHYGSAQDDLEGE